VMSAFATQRHLAALHKFWRDWR